ncbi:hypothetical protein [Paenibacillus crassostreae]|uniref:Uncharacterized protein n=1 Tax=Paenibacillus crassostreae TaxID=1763538 RepID=A0A167DC82_9BACL|nr:hypothetical protein [Paenibacillus crassostreae]AOZ94849.1 hypothetical protein LPB68_21500 [Paenibacillus crassostreae]AOZ94860.1 hypothetical protein LPB68_21585 [Paenibacillus crassostreae]OAB74196.1 hypothetical protein PNBC_12775 [Paenibacillus crassostreae]
MKGISVSQSSANIVLQQKLDPAKQYTFQEIKDVLATEFNGINDNQCSGLIHRSHSKTDGVLVKSDKYYQLRATATTTNNGLEEAKSILKDALREIELIPNKQIKTAEQFNELIELKRKLNELIK